MASSFERRQTASVKDMDRKPFAGFVKFILLGMLAVLTVAAAYSSFMIVQRQTALDRVSR